MALKAAVLPMLMREIKMVNIQVKKILLTGVFKVGLTCRQVNKSLMSMRSYRHAPLRATWKRANRCHGRTQKSDAKWMQVRWH